VTAKGFRDEVRRIADDIDEAHCEPGCPSKNPFVGQIERELNAAVREYDNARDLEKLAGEPTVEDLRWAVGRLAERLDVRTRFYERCRKLRMDCPECSTKMRDNLWNALRDVPNEPETEEERAETAAWLRASQAEQARLDAIVAAVTPKTPLDTDVCPGA